MFYIVQIIKCAILKASVLGSNFHKYLVGLLLIF